MTVKGGRSFLGARLPCAVGNFSPGSREYVHKRQAPKNMPPARILVASDDARFCELLSTPLVADGYDVVAAGGARAVARQAACDADAAIVDAATAHGAARWLQTLEAAARVPTIAIASALDGASLAPLWHRVDAVLRGPFDAHKLLLIVRGLLAGRRRTARHAEQPLSYGPLVLHSPLNTATIAAREIPLTGVETRVLRELMLAASAPVARDRLAQCGLRRESPPEDRCLDTHIKRLRRKLGPDRHGRTPIRTVRSIGYLLVEQWQPAG